MTARVCGQQRPVVRGNVLTNPVVEPLGTDRADPAVTVQKEEAPLRCPALPVQQNAAIGQKPPEKGGCVRMGDDVGRTRPDGRENGCRCKDSLLFRTDVTLLTILYWIGLLSLAACFCNTR